ncbi:13591_t:CDS:2 [Entrophospora sp. SA101]|nr:13591_t:CDS:2 [Entrophospora sp. SA101]
MPRIGENSVNSTIDSIASRTRTELKSRKSKAHIGTVRSSKLILQQLSPLLLHPLRIEENHNPRVIIDVDTVESSKLVATTTTTTTPSTPDERKSKSHVTNGC